MTTCHRGLAVINQGGVMIYFMFFLGIAGVHLILLEVMSSILRKLSATYSEVKDLLSQPTILLLANPKTRKKLMRFCQNCDDENCKFFIQILHIDSVVILGLGVLIVLLYWFE